MHVLVACHAWYGDLIGGSFRLASELAAFLAERGHRVSFVCCAQPTAGGAPIEDVRDRLRLFRYPAPDGSMNRFGRLRYHVAQTHRLTNQINRDCRVDAASLHSPLQGLGAAKALRGTRAFLNYTVHSPFDDELLSNHCGTPGIVHRLAARIGRRIDGRNVRLADRIQTDSQFTMDVFHRRHGRSAMIQKGIVASGWVDTERFRPFVDRRCLRQELWPEISADVPLFFTLRRLEQRMGLDTLVDACCRLKDEGLSFRVLIGGSGSLREGLQWRIDKADLRKHVQLLGRLPEEDLPKAYAAADCFVLPTRALECFGLIVLEAFACDTPVIASDVAAIPELAGRQGAEWLFTADSVEELAGRMRAFVMKQLQPTVDLRSVAEEFSRDAVLPRWEALLTATGVP
ncbi:MAG: glycosyltransferase family 4 protein [Planctomycetaceae bacterium]|nr:glycosyltransferase family 4 protein [Planctomycetaceae bacterium]MCA9085974.1 glycosyltransferase family 4 protein [Planctomycetaceae bacterium]